MYLPMADIESFGKKVISLADKVSAGAAKVKGAVQGAGAGAKTSPYQPYVMPVLVAVLATAAVMLATRGRKRGR